MLNGLKNIHAAIAEESETNSASLTPIGIVIPLNAEEQVKDKKLAGSTPWQLGERVDFYEEIKRPISFNAAQNAKNAINAVVQMPHFHECQ